MIDPTGIIIDAKSGISGAGRTPKLSNLFSECNESVTAYSIGKHRHTPEIEQVLADVGGSDVQVAFQSTLDANGSRHLLFDLSTFDRREISVRTSGDLPQFYAGQPFIRVVDQIPTTKDVSFTNFCDITVRFNRKQLVVFAAIDNLIKGASGVAIQNMNLMLGLDQRMGMLSVR